MDYMFGIIIIKYIYKLTLFLKNIYSINNLLIMKIHLLLVTITSHLILFFVEHRVVRYLCIMLIWRAL